MDNVVARLAKAITDMSEVMDDGRIEFRMVDDYAEAVGIGVEETDELLDEACDMLVESGSVTIVGGECYDTGQWLAHIEAGEDYQQAMLDERQAYWQSIWG